MVGGCRGVWEWDVGRVGQWWIAIATTTTSPTGSPIIQDVHGIAEVGISRVRSRFVGVVCRRSQCGGIWRGCPNRGVTVGEGEELSFICQLISGCGCGGHVKRFLVLFERMGLRAGLDNWTTSHGVCSVVFTSVSLNILSETVPLMNSNESRRSEGVYTSLGTRQKRVEGFEDIGLSICALPL